MIIVENGESIISNIGIGVAILFLKISIGTGNICTVLHMVYWYKLINLLLPLLYYYCY